MLPQKPKSLALGLVFLLSCAYDETHVYSDNDNEYISIQLSNNKKDRFVLYSSHADFDGESIEIEYRGEFIKDSVDLAVMKYKNGGHLPLKSDLN